MGGSDGGSGESGSHDDPEIIPGTDSDPFTH